jgi:predicted phage terminase large subunit-like protein
MYACVLETGRGFFDRAWMLNGDWTARMAGGKFQREWFKLIHPADIPDYDRIRWVRYWDLAATEPKPGADPDWTVGTLMGKVDGQYYITDVKRVRKTPKGVEDTIKKTAMRDGRGVSVYMEQEPGASGVTVIDHYRRKVLKGYAFYGHKTTRQKEIRANPVSSAAEAENVFIVDDGTSGWLENYLDEMEAFPNGDHDDQVDTTSGAFEALQHGDDYVYEDLVSVEEPW